MVYIFVAFDFTRKLQTISDVKKMECLGIDLKPEYYSDGVYCDSEGNLKAIGQIKINVRDKNSNQTKAIIGDAVKTLVTLAHQYECPITVENLDFERKKATMKEEGVRYCPNVIKTFAYSCFFDMLNSHAFKHGIEVIKVNPAFSSLIGLTKFMRLYGLSSDTAAALVLARRALRKKERIPTSYARLVQVDSSRHVLEFFWNALSKKLFGIKRHSFL